MWAAEKGGLIVFCQQIPLLRISTGVIILCTGSLTGVCLLFLCSSICSTRSFTASVASISIC